MNNLTLRRIKTALSKWMMIPEKVYVVIALVSVIGFALITPPLQGPDEEVHYVRVQYIAQGYIVPFNVLGTNASLPKSIETMTKITFYDHDLRGRTADKYELYRSKEALKLPLRDGKTYQPLMASYSPVPYAPAAIGVAVANLFNASPLISLYIARLLLGLTSIALIFFAIKIVPHKKYLFVAVGLIPMLLFQESVVTVDSVSYALLALFVAYVLYLRQVPEIAKKQWLILGAISIAIVLAKPLVFLFLPLIILLARRNTLRWIAGITLACIAVFATWLVLTSPKGPADPTPPPNGANAQLQMHELIAHPNHGLRVAWNSYMTPYGDDQTRGVIGVFGAADAYYPLWMWSGYVILLGVLCATNTDTKRIKRIETPWIILCAVLCLGYFVAANLALYLSYTPVNYTIVYGMQGRYFLPIVIVAVAVLCTGGLQIQKADVQKLKYWSVVSMIILVFLALFITYQRYYLYTP